MDEKREAQLVAVRELKAKGVTAIKLELEGTMQRRSVDGAYARCTTCSGQGNSECQTCTGIGWLIDSEGYETDDECTVCEGLGHMNCADCVGVGRRLKDGHVDFSNDTIALKWFMAKVDEKLGQTSAAIKSSYKVNPYPWMSFIKLYYDGSVDTEVTFTVRLDNEENIFLIPPILEVFKEMADTIGKGLDVRGAGMHTALVFDENCNYPSTTFPLTNTQISNFKRSVIELLPAFYFLATATGRSRGMGFRAPVMNGGVKGSAISIHNGAIEFRIFDTCYEVPTATLDNIVAINNLMKFATSRYTSPGVAEEIGKDSIEFGNNTDQTLGRLFVTADQIQVLYAGLPKIMPSYYTIDELKAQREFNRSLGDADDIARQQREQAEMEYAEYEERFAWQQKAREMELRGRLTTNILNRIPISELRGMTQVKLKKMADDQVKSEMATFVRAKKKASVYITSRVKSMQSSGRGEYTLAFN